MRTLILTIILMASTTIHSQNNDSISKLIIGMENSALERWNNGDPSGYLEIYAKDIVYFDPMMEHRLDGLDKLTELYEGFRGKIHITKCDMINPKVQAVDNMAVLTFNLILNIGDTVEKWNTTEVYRLENDNKWKIIQAHWSLTKPDIK